MQTLPPGSVSFILMNKLFLCHNTTGSPQQRLLYQIIRRPYNPHPRDTLQPPERLFADFVIEMHHAPILFNTPCPCQCLDKPRRSTCVRPVSVSSSSRRLDDSHTFMKGSRTSSSFGICCPCTYRTMFQAASHGPCRGTKPANYAHKLLLPLCWRDGTGAIVD